jgi:hypothetical protein
VGGDWFSREVDEPVMLLERETTRTLKGGGGGAGMGETRIRVKEEKSETCALLGYYAA